MKIHLATAASAVALAAAGAAPALANEQAVAMTAAAPTLIADQAILAAASTALPLTSAETKDELSGVVTAAASDTAPVTIIAGSNASLTTAAAASADMVFDSAAVAAAVQASSAAAEKRSESFTVVLNQDSFFGFYPTFSGLIPVSENVDLSFYGILWTTSDFSSAAGLGADLWTEFGVGANFYAMDGNLTINPQLGFTNGALLSRGNLTQVGGVNTTLNGGNVFDGLVPSLTMNYDDDTFEAEFYGGYYAALRNRTSNVGALDFLHTWVNAGYKFTPNFSGGAHYELLSNTRVDLPGAGASAVYHWVGPYVQFSLDNGFFARFTGGWDVATGNQGDFYKLSVGFSF